MIRVLYVGLNNTIDMVKYIILLVLIVFGPANANSSLDGAGFFTVVVQVFNHGTNTPVKGAQVHLEDPGVYRELELDPKKHQKVLPNLLGKQETTDSKGIATVMFYAKWSSMITKTKQTTTIPLKGVISVRVGDKEVYRKSLKQWAKDCGYIANFNSTPYIRVSVDSKK